MQSEPAPKQQQPVIRTYRGRDRRSAEDAYRVDAAQAGGAGWFPVAHRWTEDWQGPSLAVVFEYRPPAAPATPAAPTSVAEASAPVAQPASAMQGPAPAVPSGGRPSGEQPSGEQPSGEQPSDAGRRADGAADEAPTAARAHVASKMEAIDLHCAGEPLRLIRSGFPQVPFAPILERRRWAQENADAARRVAMHEPRGHRDMYGAILLPPFRADADVAVLFMHNEGFSTMCGHGIIALATALVEERLFPATVPETTIRFETPAGLVTARAQVRSAAWGGPEVDRVRFSNVASFLAARDLEIRPEDLDGVSLGGGRGSVRVDLAFGGAYYGVVDAADLGLRVVPQQIDQLTRAGAAITRALRRDHTPKHPTDPDLGFVYGTIIVEGLEGTERSGEGGDGDVALRNVTIFAESAVDRSPCGSGTSALLARAFARGSLTERGTVLNAGITGESFRGSIDGRTWVGAQEAVETTIEGRAYLTGYPSFLVDDRDPLGQGFLLG